MIESRVLYYYALVLHVFYYADIIWGDKDNSTLMATRVSSFKLQVSQNTAAKKFSIDHFIHQQLKLNCAEHKYMNIRPSPPPPPASIGLATSLRRNLFFFFSFIQNITTTTQNITTTTQNITTTTQNITTTTQNITTQNITIKTQNMTNTQNITTTKTQTIMTMDMLDRQQNQIEDEK